MSVLTVTLLVLLLVLPGCGSKAEASTATNTPIPSPAAPKTTPAPKEPPPPSPKASASPVPKPALTTVSFTMSLATAQEYTEYTMPLYLKPGDRLHLNWAITTGGDHMGLSFTTPDGELIVMKRDDTLMRNYPATYPDEKLYNMGNVIFSPGDYGWQEGYYIFHPHIRRGDAAVGVKVFYWLES